MFKVGITGGIGSGKTFIADVFSLMGVPVYNSDVRAKEIMHSSADVKLKIKSTFGSQSYQPDGQLNRAYLAEKVFSDPELLSKLNAIVHPAVAQDFDEWCDEQGDAPYVLKEAALIFESGI